MIEIPEELDLGRDEARMKGGRDADRQRETLRTLLARMYSDESSVPHWPLQILADEVGMGKTFVALGLAYSVLKQSGHLPTLADCAPKVLIIVPQNAVLVDKWAREVGEFANRCFDRFHCDEVRRLCAPSVADRVDDLTSALHEPGSGIVITHMGVLSGGKRLLDYDRKRRLLLAALFQYWGKRKCPLESRALLLKGAPEKWPRKPEQLDSMCEVASLSQCVDWLSSLSSRDEGKLSLDALFFDCVDLAKPYTRNRSERFGKVEKALNGLYREMCFAGLAKPLPLVVVDEAHNWKNGPKGGSNGYDTFRNWIAPLTRRLLMLTATPFQLRPEEMLSLVRAAEGISPSSESTECQAFRERMERFREATIRPVLERSATRSRAFAKAWAKLSNDKLDELGTVWDSERLRGARQELSQLANRDGVVHEQSAKDVISQVVQQAPSDLRDIVAEALWLYTLNQDLSQELGALIIRHRRKTEHRCVKVGSEFQKDTHAVAQRTDRQCLHAAPGIDVRGSAELPHYLLMRAVSEMKQGCGRTSLGTALTGCYSTLQAGDEAQRLRGAFAPGSVGERYLQLLNELVDAGKDPEHPKVTALTNQVLAAWRRGEKFLVFCFRRHTAQRLREILEDLVQQELQSRLLAIGITEERLTDLRSRLTRRDDSLINLVQDRVLWSLCWAGRSSSLALPEIKAESLRLHDAELVDLARLAIRAGVDLGSPALDRVFIHRATEHLLARRLLGEVTRGSPLFRQICERIADESWVQWSYGISPTEVRTGPEEIERAGIERPYSLDREASNVAVAQLAQALRERRRVLDSYAEAPCFWLGSNPEQWLTRDDRVAATLTALHSHLLHAMREGTRLLWEERQAALWALRRTVLARSLLIRILPGSLEREEQGWAEASVQGLFRLDASQHETLAERLTVLLEDFRAASGPSNDPQKTRYALLDAIRGRSGAVALVEGQTDQDTRKRVFMGFNSPLLPDVLVCTSVGAEGIDLHRHCRHVVHYDLAWNPAVLEQRTGRVDRIGSKAHRDRMHGTEGAISPFLEVGVPFLAGTYDERMFEELRTRAQIFEVLTGGDVSADNLEGRDDGSEPEGVEQGFSVSVLPASMVEDLRVKLHVWE